MKKQFIFIFFVISIIFGFFISYFFINSLFPGFRINNHIKVLSVILPAIVFSILTFFLFYSVYKIPPENNVQKKLIWILPIVSLSLGIIIYIFMNINNIGSSEYYLGIIPSLSLLLTISLAVYLFLIMLFSHTKGIGFFAFNIFFDKIIICVFITLLVIPTMVLIIDYNNFSIEEFRKTEKRLPASFPTNVSIEEFAPQFEDWFNDHFGFRKQLILSYADILKNIHVSIHPEKAFFGQNNFLFLGNDFGNVLDKTRQIPILTDNQIIRFAEIIKLRSDCCNAAGVEHYIIITPNKHTIYREYLPLKYQKNITDINQTDSIIQELKKRKLNIIDLRIPLLEYKIVYGDILFYRSGTHWTDLGAFLSYKYIIDKMNAFLTSIEIKNFSVKDVFNRRDLSFILYLKGWNDYETDLDINYLQEDISLQITDIKTQNQEKNDGSILIQNENQYIVENPDALNPKTIIIFRDSFATKLSQFFNQTFQKIIYFHYNTKESKQMIDLINYYKPDIILFQIVERSIRPDFWQPQYINLWKNFIKNKTLSTFKSFSGEELFNEILKFSPHIQNIRIEDKNLIFDSIDKDPRIILRHINIPTGTTEILFNISLYTPVDGSFKLFYLTSNAKNSIYSEKDRIRYNVSKGENNFILTIPNLNLTGDFRIDPIDKKCNGIVIHNLEIKLK